MKSNIERWKYVKGYGSLYSISSHGRVKSYYKIDGRVLSSASNGRGYLTLTLVLNKKRKTHYIHRLVALHFLPHSAGLEVNHKDGNKANNHLSNLEWVTGAENRTHAANVLKRGHGEGHWKTKLTADDIGEIKAKYKNGTHTKSMLAAEYKVSRSTIYGVVNGLTWKHIKAK